jgi:hypothetical protein
LDGLLFGELTRGDQVPVPDAAPNILEGYSSTISEGSVSFLLGTGDPLEMLATSLVQGTFQVEAPGNTEFVNLVVEVRSADRAVWGLVPRVPRQESVLDPPRVMPLASLQKEMADLGVDSTFATLMVLAKARTMSQTITAMPTAAVDAALSEALVLRGVNASVDELYSMVQRLLLSESSSRPVLRAFPGPEESYLDIEALDNVDYTGDDVADLDTGAFDQAVNAAIALLSFEACYAPDVVRLVLVADLRAGAIDRNCTPINPFLWAKDEPGKHVFVTGGIHKTTPRCGDSPPPCLDDATVDATNQVLGNWVPNQVALYDDGTHGDAVAGDALWTLALELPWLDPVAGTGVRIGYKYTYGFPGQGWTESEEWPGNKRVLALEDQNGDHIVTRLDLFGDETTNKDRKNLLSPARGGCGVVVFPSDASGEGCVNDCFEAQVDTDADCQLDSWPTPGLAAPLTVECPE